MDKKTKLATLAFCLGTAQGLQAMEEIDLQTLELMHEESITFEELQNPTGVKFLGGNYSRSGISDGNYSRSGISAANYSRSGLSDGNYSRSGISNANYSRSGLSGVAPQFMDSEFEIPAPAVEFDEEV